MERTEIKTRAKLTRMVRMEDGGERKNVEREAKDVAFQPTKLIHQLIYKKNDTITISIN
jgi:hypothetical protein